MSTSQFLNKENIQVLWDVLVEDPIIQTFCSSQEKIAELTKLFESNLKDFYEVERKNCNNLIELNKKYMLLIINYFNSKQNIQNIKTSTPTAFHYVNKGLSHENRKITIHDESIKQAITYEEIQNERKSQFEKDYSQRQQEFTNAMTLPIPSVPNFSDKMDEPICEIELEIKRIQEQRKYDIEMINNTHQKIDNTQNELDINKTIDWLQPERTSIKNGKHISWSDDKNEYYLNKETGLEVVQENDINTQPGFFSKLKKIETTNTNNNNISDDISYLKGEVTNLNEQVKLLIERIDKILK